MKTKKLEPLVSVIMPVFNAGQYLKEAIFSIINQTYKNWELIIVDDASTDNSWQIIRDFKKNFPKKIRVFRVKKNLNREGDACVNIGFQKARGSLVAKMDADDIAHPQRLEKQVKFLLNNPDIFMVGSQAWVIDKNGKIMGEKNLPLTPRDIYKAYFAFHPMIHPSVMLRKSQVKRKNLYKIKYERSNDLLTFFAFLKTKKFANLKEKLLYYRIHGQNRSFVNIKQKYFDTLRIKWLAVTKLGYRPGFKAVLQTLIHSFGILLLPSKVLLLTYMLAKGIYTPGQLWEKLQQRLIRTLPSYSLRLKLKHAKNLA